MSSDTLTLVIGFYLLMQGGAAMASLTLEAWRTR